MTIFVLFLEFTAGELLTPFCRSAFQARIAAESRSYGKNFCNDRVNNLKFTGSHTAFASWLIWPIVPETSEPQPYKPSCPV